MRIEWDAGAVRDLEDIRAFIAADKPDAAVRVAEHIQAAVDRLSEFPLMGRQTSEPTIRILPITGTPYIVYYRPLSTFIEILAVFHGARRRFLD
jgi:plasmid stabilization system protein ParE